MASTYSSVMYIRWCLLSITIVNNTWHGNALFKHSPLTVPVQRTINYSNCLIYGFPR